GRIQTGSYTNRDGATVYTTDVVADRVEFLEWGDRAPRSGGNAGGQQGQQYAQPQQSQSYDDRDNGVPEGFQAITDDDIPF
ncbi:MAG: single-stranded DNA-binding protein, partial [Clostridia bacterium]